jgi:hypothetical protein
VWIARVLGRGAARALAAERHWKVAVVFRRSFYCRSESGSLVCFGPLSLGSGPLNVLCLRPASFDGSPLQPMAGSAAIRNGRFLHIAGRLAVSFSGAQVHRPAAPSTGWRSATVIDGLAALARDVRGRPQRGGLQALIPFLAERATDPGEAVRQSGPLVPMAMAGVEPLASWLHGRLARPARHDPIPAAGIEALIGLGPGLTPSGDDFLGGVLVALHSLGASSVARSLAAEVLVRASQRTSEISRAHLGAAADGEGLAPLHAVLAILCTSGASGMSESLSAIDAIGHTSGWDALAGVVLGAGLVARSQIGPGGDAHQP